ncbi:MAG: ABC transporter permease [Candidatus Tectomicrobia bacterium]|uniref:Transport permease protein n=1 Tax=Tectimicrobiota bacterium TaxID=2528274 RepID=A0A933GM28_UNCTE|nr:ABC transporter permease [Candidatus Tectomicrobia bacterium]
MVSKDLNFQLFNEAWISLKTQDWRVPSASWRSIRVLQRNFDSYKRYYKASLFSALGEPILYLLAMGYGLGAYLQSIEGVSYLEFITPGLLVSSAMYSATFEGTFGSYTRMVEQKNFEAIIATPLTIGDVAVGEILWGGVKGLIGSSIMFLIIVAFGLVKSWSSVFIFPLLLLVGLLFMSMSLIATAVSPTYEFFNYFFTLFISPMFFFSGIFFPLTNFPLWVKGVAWFMPLTHAVNIARSLITGQDYLSIIWDLLWLAIVTVIFTMVSMILVQHRVIK